MIKGRFAIIFYHVLPYLVQKCRTNIEQLKATVDYIKAREKLFIRLTHKGDKAILSTPYNISPRYWNKKTRKIRDSHPEANEINQALQAVTDEAARLWDEDRSLQTMADLKAAMSQQKQRVDDTTPLFVDFAQQYADQQQNGTTKKHYQTVIKNVLAFRPRIKLDEWTKQTMDQYQAFLWSKPKIHSKNTVHKQCQRIGTILNKAHAYDLIPYDANPYKIGYKVTKGEPRDIKLESDELSKMWDARNDIAPQGVKEAVQAFLLSFLLDGARVRDIIDLKPQNISNDTVTFRMHKTGKMKYVLITKRLRTLLNEIPIGDDYVLPASQRMHDKKGNAAIPPTPQQRENQVSSINAKLNKDLKKAAAQLEINQPISMHVARHTFAYLADDRGIPLVEIQQALEHSNIGETRAYIGRLRGDRFTKQRESLHDSF